MKYLKNFLLLSSIVLVSGSPLNPREEFAPNVDENKDETKSEKEVHRLSGNVVPVSYDLKIIPDLKTFTFSGKVAINVRVNTPTNDIELHSKGLKITDIKLIRGTRLIISDHVFDEEKELVTIKTSQSLSVQTEYVLALDFTGVLNDNMKGFYKSSYVIDDKEYWLATTQFETAHAREAFPCFDEPRFRAKFSISVAHFPHQKAVSNMPIESPPTQTDPAAGDRVWTKFQQSPPMATYLVAFIVSEFDSMSSADKKVTVWARPNALQHCSYALEQSVNSLKALESFTGIPYNLPKLDVMGLPDFDAGAMENWGMTTYREKYVILDKSASSAAQKARVTQVISHEFAHQWFGDLVTPVWWDYLWLNEGFARYFEYFTTAVVESNWRFDEVFVVEQVQPALCNEIRVQRAMTTSVKTREQMEEIFDIISYAKGASIIRMFEHMVTSETFKSALHAYLHDGVEKHAGTVTPEQLYAAFESQVLPNSIALPQGVSVTQIMKTWTENIGYPLITVKRNYDTGKVEIKQVAYQSLEAKKPAPEHKWIVPLTYTTKSELKFSDTRPSLWSLPDTVAELPNQVASTDWVLFNLKQTGYYRVNYDWQNWYLLIDQLMENHTEIHVLNRAQMIDDAFVLYEDKKTCHPVPFKLVRYLINERDMIPWYSAINALRTWYSRYTGTHHEKCIRKFILDIIRPAYLNFGFDIKPKDGHLERVVKSVFLSFACHLGLEGCTHHAIEEYKKNENDLNKVQPDLKGVVYCEALRHNSEHAQHVFNNLWSTYLKSEIAHDKNTILSSLGCAENEGVLKTILSKLYDSKDHEIRKQDRFWVKRSIFGSVAGVTASIQFLIEKISNVKELDDENVSIVKKILRNLENRVQTEHHIHLLKDLAHVLSALDQSKYGELTKLSESAHTKGTKTLEDKNTKAEKLVRVLDEISPSSHVTTTPIPAGAGSSALASSLWTCLPIIAYSLYRVLPIFRFL